MNSINRAIIPALVCMLAFVLTACNKQKVVEPNKVLKIEQRVVNLSMDEHLWQQYGTARLGDVLRYFTIIEKVGDFSQDEIRVKNSLPAQVAYLSGTTVIEDQDGNDLNAPDINGKDGILLSLAKKQDAFYYDVVVKDDASFDKQGPIIANAITVSDLSNDQIDVEDSRVVVSSSNNPTGNTSGQSPVVPSYQTFTVSEESLNPNYLKAFPDKVFSEIDTAITITGEGLGSISKVQLDESSELAWKYLGSSIIASMPKGASLGEHRIYMLTADNSVRQAKVTVESAGEQAVIQEVSPSSVSINKAHEFWLLGFNLDKAGEIKIGDYSVKETKLINSRLLFVKFGDDIPQGSYPISVSGGLAPDIEVAIK
ncbi:MAG: hypothetical protein NTZ80_02770 [Patescibacteria group bacterium]|nr:hypothetical protein [Patescibacteria group bacterium]